MKYKQMLKIRKTEKDPDVRDRIMLRHDSTIKNLAFDAHDLTDMRSKACGFRTIMPKIAL